MNESINYIPLSWELIFTIHCVRIIWYLFWKCKKICKQFLSFEGWASQCDLDTFFSYIFFSIFQIFSSQFRRYLRVFGLFFFFFLQIALSHPPKALSLHGSPIVVFYKKSENKIWFPVPTSTNRFQIRR